MAFGGESEVATAYVRVRANTTGFASEASGGISKGAKILAGVFAAGFVIHKAFDFGKEIVTEAAQTQKATESIVAGFGKASESVLQFSDDAAASYGISKQASEEFSSSLAITGKNLGLTQAKTAEMDVGFQKLAGSVGLIKGQDPAMYFDKLKLAMLGNTRGLKQMGIAVDTAGIKQEALKQGLIKTKDDAITPAIKAQAIYGLATAHLADFQKQAADGSGDLANQQRILSAEWANAKESLGQALLPAMATLVTLVADQMPAAIKVIQDLASVIKEDLAIAFEFIGEQVDKFRPQLDAVGQFVKDNIGVIKQFGGAFLVVASVLGVAAGAVTVLTFALGLLASPIIIVAALAAGLYVLYQNSETVRQAVGAFVDFVKADVIPVLGQFATFIGEQVNAALGYLKTLAPDAQAALDNLLTVVGAVLDALSALWDEWGGTIMTIASAIFDAVSVVVHSAMQQIKGVIDVVLGLISGDWGRAWRGVKEIMEAAWNLITGLLRVALGLMKTLLGQALSALGAAAKALGLGIVHGVENGLSNLIHSVASILGKIPGALATAAANAFSGAVTIGENIFNGIKNGIGDLKGLIEQWVRDAISDLNPFSPVEHGAEVYIGAAITKGAVKGLGGLKGALEDSLRGALTPSGGGAYALPSPGLNGAAGGGSVNLYGPVTINASSVDGMASELNKLARRVRR